MPTSGVDGAGGQLLGVLQELGLCCARVAQQQHVDVPPQAVRAGRCLLQPPEERQRDARLDVGVAVDAGGNAFADALACALPWSE